MKKIEITHVCVTVNGNEYRFSVEDEICFLWHGKSEYTKDGQVEAEEAATHLENELGYKVQLNPYR